MYASVGCEVPHLVTLGNVAKSIRSCLEDRTNALYKNERRTPMTIG